MVEDTRLLMIELFRESDFSVKSWYRINLLDEGTIKNDSIVICLTMVSGYITDYAWLDDFLELDQ